MCSSPVSPRAACSYCGPSMASALAPLTRSNTLVDASSPRRRSLVTFEDAWSIRAARRRGARVTVARAGEPASAAVGGHRRARSVHGPARTGPHNVRVAAPGFTEASRARERPRRCAGASRIRSPGRRPARKRQRHGGDRVRSRCNHQRDEDTDAAAGRAAVGHGRHPGTDQGSDDDEHGDVVATSPASPHTRARTTATSSSFAATAPPRISS